MSTKESFYQYRFQQYNAQRVLYKSQQCVQYSTTYSVYYTSYSNAYTTRIFLPVPFQQCIQLQQCLQRIVSLLQSPYCTQKLLHTVTTMSTKDCLSTTNTLLYTKATVETTDQRHYCDKVGNVEIPFLTSLLSQSSKSFSHKQQIQKYPNDPTK